MLSRYEYRVVIVGNLHHDPEAAALAGLAKINRSLAEITTEGWDYVATLAQAVAPGDNLLLLFCRPRGADEQEG